MSVNLLGVTCCPVRSHSAHLEELSAKAEAQIRVSLEQKILLACIYPRLMHFIHTVILKSPSCAGPRLHLEQIKQGQETDCKSGHLDR